LLSENISGSPAGSAQKLGKNTYSKDFIRKNLDGGTSARVATSVPVFGGLHRNESLTMMESVNQADVAICRRRDYIPILMASVRDMLEARKKEIGSKLEPLFAETVGLRKKLVELDGVISILKNEFRQIETLLKKLDEDDAKKKPITIMEAVLEIMRDKPNGMTAQQILAELNEKYFDGNIARHSLSPQLSRLKDRDKKLELRGNVWFRLPDEPSLFTPKK
jgi:hypothetical protein